MWLLCPNHGHRLKETSAGLLKQNIAVLSMIDIETHFHIFCVKQTMCPQCVQNKIDIELT